MTDTQTKEVTIHFSHDNETTTTVRAEVEYYKWYNSYLQQYETIYKLEFLEPFDKSVHGMWQMELSEQIKTL